MTGNTPELNDPKFKRKCQCISQLFIYKAGLDIEPSIRGRKLYIPIEAFFVILVKQHYH